MKGVLSNGNHCNHFFGEGQVSEIYFDARYNAVLLGSICDRKVVVGLGSCASHWMGRMQKFPEQILSLLNNDKGNINKKNK